jgi:CheY-like chemotaxis protein
MSKKVLIIDDTTDIADALKKLIELQGYTAVVARSGVEGLAKATSEHPDLILMDLSMPDIDGISVTREIRGYDGLRDVPILCVSSYTLGHEDEIIEAGCNAIFSKTSFLESYQYTLKKYLASE